MKIMERYKVSLDFHLSRLVSGYCNRLSPNEARSALSSSSRLFLPGVTVQGTSKVDCNLDEVIIHKGKRETS